MGLGGEQVVGGGGLAVDGGAQRARLPVEVEPHVVPHAGLHSARPGGEVEHGRVLHLGRGPRNTQDVPSICPAIEQSSKLGESCTPPFQNSVTPIRNRYFF